MEMIQLKLRVRGYEDAYNLCKKYSRGKESFELSEFMEFLKENPLG